MRKVNTDNLPKDNKGRFKWKESVGYIVDFEYDEIIGKIEILSYDSDREKLSVIYDDVVHEIISTDFKNSKIGKMVGKYTSNFKIEIGTIFKDDKKDIIITNREVRDRVREKCIEKEKWYEYSCNVCQSSGIWARETDMSRYGCSACSGQQVTDKNSFATIKPELIKYFKNPQEAHQVTSRSMKYVDLICDKCDSEKNIMVDTLYSQGFKCPICSDGLPITEKFLNGIFMELNIPITTQKVFDWATDKKYDVYVERMNTIVEIHGEQHYTKTFCNKDLKEEQENDLLKYNLAMGNGIRNYIVIDARYSKLDWLKENCIKELSTHFNLYNIDWNKIWENSNDTILPLIWDEWNRGELTSTKSIGEKFNLSSSTIVKYLKIGTELGKCDYDPNEQRLKGLRCGWERKTNIKE